jgi:tRNA (guanine26-N2/guanine27-N2)-dimethyltransferase
MEADAAATTEALQTDTAVKITENSAHMYFPTANAVFYNKVQVLNRDTSITMIRLYGELKAKEREESLAKKRLRKEFIEANPDVHQKDIPDFTEQGIAEVKDVDWTKFVAAEDTARKAHYATPADPNTPAPVSQGLKILDCLAASGLRSIRYHNEIPNVSLVTINDMSLDAIALATNNIDKNGTDNRIVRTHIGDGTMCMYEARSGVEAMTKDVRGESVTHPEFPVTGRYDVIDLDPYGSAAPFIDGAVQAVENGGMLNVTCTDMAVLSGNYPETCFAKYRSMPIHKGKYLHELALRILLQSLEAAANKYGRHIVPMASFGIDFYVRVFVRVFDSKAEVKNSSLKIGSVYQSMGCPSFHVVPTGKFEGKSYKPYAMKDIGTDGKCSETGTAFKIGGPFWIAPIHDLEFVDEAVKRVEDYKKYNQPHDPLPTSKRLHGMLTTVSEELHDVPLYYTLPDLAHAVRCSVPPRATFLAAIEARGYRVSATHKESDAIKTDAPNEVVWDLMRNWCKLHPNDKSSDKSKASKVDRKKKEKAKAGEEAVGENEAADTEGGTAEAAAEVPRLTPRDRILAVEPKFVEEFKKTKSETLSGRRKAQRYPMNPEANWGPKALAGVNLEKRQVKQDKKKREREEEKAIKQEEKGQIAKRMKEEAAKAKEKSGEGAAN